MADRRERLKDLLFAAIPSVVVLGLAWGTWTLWQTTRDPIAGGKALNREAWEASYLERGQQVPGEPREGYWGSRLKIVYGPTGRPRVVGHAGRRA